MEKVELENGNGKWKRNTELEMDLENGKDRLLCLLHLLFIGVHMPSLLDDFHFP